MLTDTELDLVVLDGTETGLVFDANAEGKGGSAVIFGRELGSRVEFVDVPPIIGMVESGICYVAMY